MLGDEQGEVGVLGLQGGVFVAVAVDGDDTVGVFVDNGALGIHAEGADLVAVFFRAVDDLAFVKLIGQMGKNVCGQLNADTDIHAVGLCGDVELSADLLHPFAAASSDGDDALPAGIFTPVTPDGVAALGNADAADGCIKKEFHLVLKVGVEVFKNDVVDIRSEMTDGGIQQMQIVLNAQGLEAGAGSGVELCALAAVFQVDLVDVAHQIQGLLFADVLVERAAEIVGNIIFSVRKRTCAAKTAHNGAAFAADTGLDPVAVDGAAALAEGMSGFKHGDLQPGLLLQQLICRKDTARTCADNDDVVIHENLLVSQNMHTTGGYYTILPTKKPI